MMKIQSCNHHIVRVDAAKKRYTICHSQPTLLQSHHLCHGLSASMPQCEDIVTDMDVQRAGRIASVAETG